MGEMDAIIAGIRSSYEKTNMTDVDLESILHERPEVKVGYLLQHMDPESEKPYAINFDPVETLFLDKLVSEEVLNGEIVMDKNDFFRGIVFLDYLTTVVLDDYAILKDMHNIAVELENIQEDLDPDLELVVKYSGMFYLSYTGRRIMRNQMDEKGLERYQVKNKHYEPEYAILRKIAPVYEALGKMVCDLPKHDIIKEKLPDMLYLYDIKAAIFVDAILDFIEDDALKEKVVTKFREGDYYKASMVAITGISKQVSNTTIDEYITSLVENGGNNDGS